MQAIVTKYIGPTNTRGSRIKASCERGNISISYPHELNGDAIHVAAADALVAKFIAEDAKKYGTHANPWAMPRVVGYLPDGRGVHVYCDPMTHLASIRKGDTVHINRKGSYKLCTVKETWHGKDNAWLVVVGENGNEMSVCRNSRGELV